MSYFRPLVQPGLIRPAHAVPLLGRADLWFTDLECLSRDQEPVVVGADTLDPETLKPFVTPRAEIAGLDLRDPRIMGIVNVTPDSFSDGGLHGTCAAAVTAALQMVADGADILDIGGESTRPGAQLVAPDVETERVAPVIADIRRHSAVPISVDTRKADVAAAALRAGATLVNDVAGFTFDAGLAPLCARNRTPVCVMHAQGDPATMQNDPVYDNVLLDVYDFLARRIADLEKTGIPRDHILVDPGIGFGKTLEHNLCLLHNISLFHGLGCGVLLGASRKRFIGTIGNEPQANRRFPGSVAVALAALAQGVQVLRVHDVAETVQATRVWAAVT